MSLSWLASYPRSGNTWLRAVLSGLSSGANARVDINQLEGPQIASSRKLVDEALGVPTADLTEDEIAHFRVVAYRHLARQATGQRFIKIHDAYQPSSRREPIIPLDVPSQIIYVVRNPLDTVVSAAYFSDSGTDRIIACMAQEDFSQNFHDDELLPQLPQRLTSWSRHVEGWLNQSTIPTLAVRYENMLKQPQATFEQICRFIGFSTEHLSSVIQNASFDALQAQETARGFHERPRHTRIFFRKGISGGWRSELSTAQVARIVQDHGPMMRRLGYLMTSGEIIDCPQQPIAENAQGKL